MYLESDIVVEAVVTKSRRWSEGAATLHLVAKYKVLDVFKGDVDQNDILIVTDTCMDEPVPERMQGYPVVESYCRGLIGLQLPGIDSRTGKPIVRPQPQAGWLLFLRKNTRKGAPELTWLEESRTSFSGGIRQDLNDLAPEQRAGFERLLKCLSDGAGR